MTENQSVAVAAVGLIEAVQNVLLWRVGELPDKGFIRDNDPSRQAIDKMAKALASTRLVAQPADGWRGVSANVREWFYYPIEMPLTAFVALDIPALEIRRNTQIHCGNRPPFSTKRARQQLRRRNGIALVLGHGRFSERVAGVETSMA